MFLYRVEIVFEPHDRNALDHYVVADNPEDAVRWAWGAVDPREYPSTRKEAVLIGVVPARGRVVKPKVAS